MTCAVCGGAIKRHSVYGFVHADGRYFCDPWELTHACIDQSANVMLCESTRKRFGF